MNSYIALIRNDIRLAFRQKIVIFFNYLMPLVFFFIFAQSLHAEQGGAIVRVVTMVSVIGILGNGLVGAGMRAVQDRETNILRRYKVAPISPLPLLVASTVTGLVVYLPFIALIFAIARFRYGMQIPAHMAAVMVFITLGVVAIRAIGLILSSVVNSMAEAQVLVQILYLAMLMLSGTTFPVSMLPAWLQTTTQFIPSTWLVTGLQGIMIRGETLLQNWQATGALLLTIGVGLLISVKLFRWEKEQKIRPAAKLWVVAALFPFIVLGAWQAHSKDNVIKARLLDRDITRSRSWLIRNARIFVGDGRVIDNGAVLVREGRIAAVFDGYFPDAKSLNAEAIEGAGKTILPGLIDTHVHLGAQKVMQRELAAYLYSGVTAVRSAGDAMDQVLKVRDRVNSGEKQGAELFIAGPVFKAAGGQGTEILPPRNEGQSLRLPKTATEARRYVDELNRVHVDGIEAIDNQLDPAILDSIAAAAHADNLPVMVHTADVHDVENALHAGADGIEQGSFWQKIPDSDFAAMATAGVAYDPTLSLAEAYSQLTSGNVDLATRSLVQQVGPPDFLAEAKNLIQSPAAAAVRRLPIDRAIADDNLMRAFRAGVTLVAGSDAGNMLVFHGPSVQHEVQLWVEAGVPAELALRAATLNAAKSLRADGRMGSIEIGKEATMLAVEGNPLQDIRALEAISAVIFKGERMDRAALLKTE